MSISYIFKPHKMTNLLTYKVRGRGNSLYKMADAKTGSCVGLMLARPTTIRDPLRRFSPNADEYCSFFIDRIYTYIKNHGVGSAFINIAKKESIRNFCSGNVHLISKNTRSPLDMPHLFYRKHGFKCNKYYKSSEKYFDECLKEGKPIETTKYGIEIPMYIEKCVKNQLENINKWYMYKVRFPRLFDRL